VRRAFGVDEDEGEVSVVERAWDGQVDDLKLHCLAKDGPEAKNAQRVRCNDSNAVGAFYESFVHRAKASFLCVAEP
jgi:hypothetical protein